MNQTTQAQCPPIEAKAAELLEWLRHNYDVVRVLPDGSIAARSRLLFTTAIFLGLDRWGFGNRFCFESPTLAAQRFNELTSEDDEPAGYIARRPEVDQ